MIPTEVDALGVPAEVNILGVTYRVDEVEIVDRENYYCVGKCDPRAATITVCRDLNESIKQQTIIHETIHAILESLSLHDESANEVLVQGLAAGIYNAWGDKIFGTGGSK